MCVLSLYAVVSVLLLTPLSSDLCQYCYHTIFGIPLILHTPPGLDRHPSHFFLHPQIPDALALRTSLIAGRPSLSRPSLRPTARSLPPFPIHRGPVDPAPILSRTCAYLLFHHLVSDTVFILHLVLLGTPTPPSYTFPVVAFTVYRT